MNEILNWFQELFWNKGTFSIEIKRFLWKAKNRTFKFYYSEHQKRVWKLCLEKTLKKVTGAERKKKQLYAEILSDPDIEFAENLEKLASKMSSNKEVFMHIQQ